METGDNLPDDMLDDLATQPKRLDLDETMAAKPVTQDHLKRSTDRYLADIYIEGDLTFGSVYAQGTVVVSADDFGKVWLFTGQELNEITIGREDTRSGHKPTIDLTKNGGKKRGVSRKHAVIMRRDDVLVVVDQHSLNGTYLNGVRLQAGRARVLRDGDVLHISDIRLNISFQLS